MNTSRPTSRNAGPSASPNTGTAPRRKVASMAQMDISSLATFQAPSSIKPMSYSGGGSSTVSSSSTRPILVSTNSSASLNGSQSGAGSAYPNVAPPRLSSVNRGRSSNSVVSTASYRSTTSTTSTATAGRDPHITNGGPRAVVGTTGTGGSVTSDDGTISEDSDRAAAGDEMQLVSGGNNSMTYGSSGRHISAASVTAAGSTYSPPQTKQAASRTRTSSSTIGLSNGNSGMNSNNNSGTSTPTHKPMRIAAGASIKVEIAPTPSVSTISSTGTTVASLLTVRSGNNSNGGGDDGGSSVSGISSVASGISLNTSQLQQQLQQQQQMQQMQQQPFQQQSQPTIRSVKPTGATTTSNASATAAATKLAEENRRQEEAARTRRKIADLEISNASLLSINSSLEATIRKQVGEMQELKIRMQSSQYGGGDLGITAADLALAQSVEAIELTESEKQDELTFKRLCLTIEQMVFEAKQALDQSLKPTGVKVLTLYDMYEKEQQEEAAAAAATAEAEAEPSGGAGIEDVEDLEQDTSAISIPSNLLDGENDIDLEEAEDELEEGGYPEKRDSVLDKDSPKDRRDSSSDSSSSLSLATPPPSSTATTILDPSCSSSPPASSLTAVAT